MSNLNFPLSNVQLELLKLYSKNIPEEEMLELKKLLASFFARKSMDAANEVWDKKGYSDELMDKWIYEENQLFNF